MRQFDTVLSSTTAVPTAAPAGAFSLNRLFDRAMETGQLHGLRLDGQWLHVGTPESLKGAEERIAASAL